MAQKVLIIDNESGMRQVIAKILTPQGYTVLDADEAAAGLELAGKEKPDIVLMDIRLPDMDAPDLLAALKKNDPNLPVIVLSGFGDVDAAIEIVKQGAYDHLAKPFKVDSLIQLVNKGLSKKSTSSPSSAAQPSQTQNIQAKPDPGSSKNQPGTAAPQLKSKFPVKTVSIAFTAAILIAGGVFFWMKSGGFEKDADFNIKLKNPSAICYDMNKRLHLIDWMTAELEVFLIDQDKSLNLQKLPGDIQPSGIATDGSGFWVADSFGAMICKYDAGKSSFTATYPSPGANPSGLCHDGKSLWSLDFQSSKAFRHNLDDKLSVAETFECPVKNPRSMFVKGDSFFMTGAATNKLYQVRRSDFFLEGIYNLPKNENAGTVITSVAFDGKNLWVCYEGLSKLLRFSFKNLKKENL